MMHIELKQSKLHRESESPIKKWEDLRDLYYSKFSPEDETTATEWIFRGDSPNPESCVCVPDDVFETKLDRAFKCFGVKDPSHRRQIEQRLIRDFRRKARLHTPWPLQTWLDILSLMQHHGAPTRLLDWTYSFFVAVFFAINRADGKSEDADTGNGSCVVWALDSEWLAQVNKGYEERYIKDVASVRSTKEGKTPNSIEEDLRELRNEHTGIFESNLVHDLIMAKEQPLLVYAVNPYRLHERLSTQRGVLLCQGSIDKAWGANLRSVLSKDTTSKDPNLYRIRIAWDNHKGRNQILRRLREMSIDHASLFPGLDGFAESLRTIIACPPQRWLQGDLGVDTTNRVSGLQSVSPADVGSSTPAGTRVNRQ